MASKLPVRLVIKHMIEQGTQLQGRYLIEQLVGEGGMGAVYLAVDRKFGTQVAIKETFYGEPELAEAFEREARLLNGLHHPILPHVSDYFTENGGHFLVMEYIEGEDISTILKRGERFSIDEVMRWAVDLLDGLDYLHSQDPPIIHRDIKPNNLKLTSRGNIMLLDFGMAKETSGNTLGMRSVFGYSRRYSPLEQIEGTGTDIRSDLFSLGATIFHLLAGKPPTDVLARASAIVAGRQDTIRTVREFNPDVPDPVAAVVSTALALNPDERFDSARSMRTALENAFGAGEDAPVALEETLPPAGALPAGTFPALEAYEAETEATANGVAAGSGTIHLGLIDTMGVVDYLPKVAVADPDPEKHSEAPPATAAEQVRIRKPFQRKSLLWLPVVLVCAALLAFGIYRQQPAAETAREEPAATEISEETPENASADVLPAETLSQAEPDTEEQPALEDPPLFSLGDTVDRDEAELEEDEALKSSARRTEKPVKKVEAPNKLDREADAKPSRSASQAPRRRSTLPNRPRIVRSAPYRRDTASGIEAVMNGRRYHRRPRWLDRWEEEDRFRRRARRARWEGRNRFPLF